ncbi:hypothetical protein AB0F43_31575 [Kribbella sp. NPDC023972]|uniref:hypothetical protein n=1 Tax=Kribbella sp. NPDC023972 TaxID=3154795 RepID=UPI00340F5B73
MSSEDEDDLAIIEQIRARGPVWVPQEEANALMNQIEAEADTDDSAEDAEDAAAMREWDALKASGEAVTVPHEEARRRLGLD